MRYPVFGFPTKSDTNRAAQPLELIRCFKFRIQKSRDCTSERFTICLAKTKALISCVVSACSLICGFAFAYEKIRFSHGAAHYIYMGNHTIWVSNNRVMTSLRECADADNPCFCISFIMHITVLKTRR